ncbi:MAG: hypothetical protein KIT09_06445 [Bryobacteraceae bacterium]|nr:hypothetical protein [Bryobacteraceae bacterium]
MPLNRRRFLRASAALPSAAPGLFPSSPPATRSRPEGFFTVGQSVGRWWLFNPKRERVFSLGLNHVDPATLRYPENADIWRRKYGNSMKRWLETSVRPNLLSWAFNCVGWTQEVVTRGPTNHRHSRAFTFEEYQWLGLPYFHLVPVAPFHQWEAETRHPDLFSPEFAAWCDHVAREHCAPLADDPKLVGYFYVDCPTWTHTTEWTAWKGPLFDPARLDAESGRKELSNLAAQYYRTVHDAVRRHDPNHLIFGDRYEALAPLPAEVVLAAKPYVDVLSFQHFGPPDRIAADFARWRELSGMPILLADGCGSLPAPGGYRRQDGPRYRETLAVLRENPACLGYHLCGAYLANRTRKRGLLDERERPDRDALEIIAAANRETARWARDVLSP